MIEFRGTLAFIIEDDYLGVAIVGLRGRLFPAVSCVFAGTMITMKQDGRSWQPYTQGKKN